MYSLELSFLNGLKFPADISAGISALSLLRDDAYLYEKESPSRGSFSTTATLPDKKHVHSSDAARQGYLEALAYIHEHKPSFTIETLCLLHHKVFQYLDNSGGHFKTTDNVLMNQHENGTINKVHTPVKATNIPETIQNLINAYERAVTTHSPLVVIPLTLLDFVLIHPFSDGNGRMFRLLSVLLLYQAGFHCAQDLNFDYVLQNSRGSGQKALAAGVAGWRESKHNVLPWVAYFIGALSYASITYLKRAPSPQRLETT